MAKVTFRRTLRVLARSKLNALLPVIGGLLFLIGSVFFWPSLELFGMDPDDVGATLFLTGSVLYLVAPVLDYMDMTYSLEDTLQQPSTNQYERLYRVRKLRTDIMLWLSCAAVRPPRCHLLSLSPRISSCRPQNFTCPGSPINFAQAQITRTQRANTLLYSVAGVCFVLGSVLFYPRFRAESTHGAWLYLMGCVLSFIGAFLAASTAHELKKTAEEQTPLKSGLASLPGVNSPAGGVEAGKGEGGKEASGSGDLSSEGSGGSSTSSKLIARLLPRTTLDEDAHIASCSLYMLGDVIFVIGSIFFFPRTIMSDERVVEGDALFDQAAVALFIVGSVVFVAGAGIDLLVLLRHEEATLAADQHAAPTEATNLVSS